MESGNSTLPCVELYWPEKSVELFAAVSVARKLVDPSFLHELSPICLL
jgi:hypothetical protein